MDKAHETQAADLSRISSTVDAAKQLDDQFQLDDPKSAELSAEFEGRWSQLISVTNWEKGKIITQWRDTLMGSQAPASAYSDEAWSRRVGSVSPQHVGRLRRVYERFADEYQSFSGLYWTHFLVALDWDDAEMWLEGASRSAWSVSHMRRMRWEAMGSDPRTMPSDSALSVLQEDEDFTPLSEVDEETNKADRARQVAEGPRPEGPDFGEEPFDSAATPVSVEDDLPWDEPQTSPQSSPFANLPSLPTDFAEAVEQFKLAIIRHRADSWAEVAQSDVLKALDALRLFAAM